MAIPDLLKGCPLFFELYDTEIERIVSHCLVSTHAPGELVVRDGEEGNEIFVVLDGTLQIQKTTPTGLIKIQTLGQGDVFGEVVLIDERTRTADIVANSECHILEIGFDDVFGLFQK